MDENIYQDEARNVIVTIRGVEPGLAAAAKKLEARLGRPLQGIDLIDVKAVDNKYRMRDKSGFFKEIICDFDNPAELQQVLMPYLDTALVMTCRLEEAIKDFRRAALFLPYINTPTETSLEWCTQKRLMRDRMHAYDPALVPKYVTLTSYDSEAVSAQTKDFSFPVIVKPNGLYSSLLVSRCNNEEELHACLARTFELIEDVYAQTDGTGVPSLLVEEMMQGDMYSVDVCVGPRGEFYTLPPVEVTTAHSIGLPGFYGYRYDLPAKKLTEEQTEGAYKAAHAAVRALNLRSTPVHIELFLTPSGWKIIELGPRIGGYREALYREVYGVDMRYNELLVRIGLEPEISPEVLKKAVCVAIYAEEEGVITEISGIDEARKLASTVFVGVQAKVGDMALFADSGGELIVDAVLSNADPEQLESDAAKIRELVSIKVRPRDSEEV